MSSLTTLMNAGDSPDTPEILLQKLIADTNTAVTALQDTTVLLVEKATQLTNHERLMGTSSDPGHVKLGVGFERLEDGTVNINGTADFEAIMSVHLKDTADFEAIMNAHLITERVQHLGTVSGVVNVDLRVGYYVTASVGAATTLNLSGATENGCTTVLLELANGGIYPITWGMSPKWPNGAAPTLAATGVDLVCLCNRGDGWRGVLVASDVR